MKTISSNQNDTFKQLKQLAASAKHRRNSGRTLLEGIHLCENYLARVGTPLLAVCTPAALEGGEAAKIIAVCEERSVPILEVGAAKFSAISGVENGVGLLFVIEIPHFQPPKTLSRSCLLLDTLQDPGNIGTILRTAAAAGIPDVFLSNGCASVWSPKVLRAAMGAHTALQIHENADLSALISASEIPVFATSLQATKTIYQANLARDSAWLFGNEGAGVSPELLALSVETVIIPQQASVESLNVAASVAICLFEQVRQVSAR